MTPWVRNGRCATVPALLCQDLDVTDIIHPREVRGDRSGVHDSAVDERNGP